MSNQVQFSAFTFKSNSVRVITDKNQEPWFCANDVCDILGYSNPRDAISKHCKENGVAKRDTIDSMQRKQETTFINEPNLYRLIIKSRKPEAEPFEAWVFEEVLPQIRKTGKYQLQPQQLSLPEPQKFTFEFTEYELQQLAWLWFAFKRGVGTFQHVEKAFKAMGSNMSGQIYGQAYEYLSVLRSTNQILNRITKEFYADPMTNWRVLQHLRQFDPKAVRIDF